MLNPEFSARLAIFNCSDDTYSRVVADDIISVGADATVDSGSRTVPKNSIGYFVIAK